MEVGGGVIVKWDFFLMVGEIIVYVYIYGKDLIEREKLMMKENIFLWLYFCIYF